MHFKLHIDLVLNGFLRIITSQLIVVFLQREEEVVTDTLVWDERIFPRSCAIKNYTLINMLSRFSELLLTSLTYNEFNEDWHLNELNA